MSTTIRADAGLTSNAPGGEAAAALAAPESNPRLLLGVLELGVLGDLLLRAGGIGVNLTLWCWALLIAGIVTSRDVAMDRRRTILVATAAFFAAVPTLRADPMLVLLSGVAVITCLVLLTWTAGAPATTLFGRTIAAYIAAAWTAARHIIAGFVPLVADEVRARRHLSDAYRTPAAAILRGVFLAAPVLLVFGALLVNADAAYATLVGKLFRWDVDTVVSHIVLTGIFSWLAAAFLLAPRRWSRYAPHGTVTGVRLGAIEAGTVVALVDALFLSFVLVQARYLFGGAELVMATAGLTYAEYARRGFFELVAVVTLALPLLIVLVSGTRTESARQRTVHRVLVAVLIGLLLLMMASALRRMWLYQAEYGWTLDRVHATALMLWIGGSILWFGTTAVRGRPERFTLGSIAGGFAVLATLALANPAAAIVRVNADRMASGKDFDGAHAAMLGTDALPALLEVLPRVAPSLDDAERCAIRRTIQNAVDDVAGDGDGSDWRLLTMSRLRARDALARHGPAAAVTLGGTGRCAASR